MKTRLLLMPVFLALVASLAACGGGGQNVGANDIAVVNGVPISIADFNSYLAQAESQMVAQGQQKPTPGSSEYTTMRNQVVAELVQIEEVKQQAPKEGISVTPSDVNKFIANLVKTNYNGSETKFDAWLKSQGLTLPQAKQEVDINLLAKGIHDKVTAGAKVTEAQEKTYYDSNISQYSTPAATTRSVQYILVKQKSLADSIEQQLQNGASFSTEAKKHSIDTTTAPQGGKYTVTKGSVVPAFDTETFKLKTGQLSGVVDATSTANRNYGYFIIKALGPVKKTSAHTSPFSAVQSTIQTGLLQQAQDKLWQQWLSDLAKQYQGKVTYQASYAPPTTTALTGTDATLTAG